MSSKRRLRRKACQGKQRYNKHEQAAFAAHRVRQSTGEHIHAYLCPHCNGYHIGHAAYKFSLERLEKCIIK